MHCQNFVGKTGYEDLAFDCPHQSIKAIDIAVLA